MSQSLSLCGNDIWSYLQTYSVLPVLGACVRKNAYIRTHTS